MATVVQLAEADPYNSSYTNQIRFSSVFYEDFLLPLYRNYVQQQGWTQPVVRCLVERGTPKPGYDYSNGNLRTLMKKGTISTCKSTQGGQHSSFSSSDISADFFSCMDDEDGLVTAYSAGICAAAEEVCDEEVLREGDGSRCTPQGGDFDEPFLRQKTRSVTRKGEGDRSRSDEPEGCCRPVRSCCKGLFICF